MSKKKVLITEFAIQVYSDGDIAWDGADKFMCWKLRQRPKEGFLPYAHKIQGFGISSESGENLQKQRLSRR